MLLCLYCYAWIQLCIHLVSDFGVVMHLFVGELQRRNGPGMFDVQSVGVIQKYWLRLGMVMRLKRLLVAFLTDRMWIMGVALMADPSLVPSAPPHSVFASKVTNQLALPLLLAPSAEERFAEAFFDCDPDASSSIGRAACHERKTSTDNIKLVASTAVQGDDSPVSLTDGDACRHERV